MSAAPAMKVHYSSATDQWATPWPLFERYRSRYGISLDVCADAENAKCNDYFDIETDGLAQDWGKRSCWCNPPYGREIGKWVEKAWRSAGHGALVVMLVPARTDTRWWHDWIWDTDAQTPRTSVKVEFLKGRVKFGDGKAGAPFPSAVVVFFPRIFA